MKAENIKERSHWFVEEPLSPEAIVLINEIKNIQRDVDLNAENADAENWKLQAVTMSCIILVIIKHLNITEICQILLQKYVKK